MGHSKKPLDARLRAAADMALETIRGIEHPHAADIGCDHGFVTAYLLRQRPDLSMIAGDVSEASLAKAQVLLSQAGLEGQVQTLCGDGLSVLEGQPAMDVILIAGMGGRTVLDILQRGEKYIGTAGLILQANTDVPVLREGLSKMGIGLRREAFPEAGGRRYVVMLAGRNAPVPDGFAGYLLGTAVNGIDSMGQQLYLRSMREQTAQKVAKLAASGTSSAKKKLEEANRILEEIDRVLTGAGLQVNGGNQ